MELFIFFIFIFFVIITWDSNEKPKCTSSENEANCTLSYSYTEPGFKGKIYRCSRCGNKYFTYKGRYYEA